MLELPDSASAHVEDEPGSDRDTRKAGELFVRLDVKLLAECSPG